MGGWVGGGHGVCQDTVRRGHFEEGGSVVCVWGGRGLHATSTCTHTRNRTLCFSSLPRSRNQASLPSHRDLHVSSTDQEVGATKMCGESTLHPTPGQGLVVCCASFLKVPFVRVRGRRRGCVSSLVVALPHPACRTCRGGPRVGQSGFFQRVGAIGARAVSSAAAWVHRAA